MFSKNKSLKNKAKNKKTEPNSYFPKKQKSKIFGSPLFNVALMIVILLSISSIFRLLEWRRINAPTQIQINDSEELPIDEKKGREKTRQAVNIFDGEVMDTSRRLREIGALGFAASLSILDEATRKKQVPGSVNTLIEAITLRNLLPPGLIVKNGGILSATGKINIHYSAVPLQMEFVSLPDDPRFGPALILRFPLSTTNGKNIVYFQSTSAANINVPRAFAPVAEVITGGWTLESWRGSDIGGKAEDFAKQLSDEQKLLRSAAPAGSDSIQK